MYFSPTIRARNDCNFIVIDQFALISRVCSSGEALVTVVRTWQLQIGMLTSVVGEDIGTSCRCLFLSHIFSHAYVLLFVRLFVCSVCLISLAFTDNAAYASVQNYFTPSSQWATTSMTMSMWLRWVGTPLGGTRYKRVLKSYYFLYSHMNHLCYFCVVSQELAFYRRSFQ